MVDAGEEVDSLEDGLRAVRRDTWTGRIDLTVDGVSVGAVVLRAGRVAWAVCADQPEDLGTYLWRLGRVTRSDLDRIRRIYADHGGRRKLGTLMDQAGIVPRNVLRRCLLLHTRRAMACLFRYPRARVRAARTELEVEEAMTFSLADVVPSMSESEFPPEASAGSLLAGRWLRWTAENRILSGLSELSGYVASGVLAREGEVLAAHAAGNIDPATIGVLVVSLLESTARTMRASGLGAVSSLCFECDHGTIVAQWLDERRTHVVMVLVEAEANPGMARYKLGSETPSLARWVRESGDAATRPAAAVDLVGSDAADGIG